MYLSNAEKEALWLTGYGDVPPWAVAQGLEQAQARGSYVPGEESLRLRLADALDLEERLATQRAEEELGSTAAAQEAAQDAPADQWRSPLQIVQEGALDEELERSGEDAIEAPAAEQKVQDRDFSGFTKAELVTFAEDAFGVELKRTESRDRLIVQVQGLVDEARQEKL